MTEQDSKELSDGRILVVAHAWYGDLIGGTFRLASEFASDLAAAGCDVDYICCAPADLGPFPEHERINGLTVHRYPALRRRSWPIGRMLHHVRHTARIVEQLAAGSAYAAVSGHSPLQSRGAFNVMRRRQPQAYLNYTVHSPFDDEMVANAKRPLARRQVARVAGWIDRRNLAKADRVQTCSQYTLKVLQQKHPRQVADKGRVAPGWVDFDRYAGARKSEPGSRTTRESRTAEAPLFFTLRRLETRMGLDTLIDAAALVRDRGLSFRVVIGGNGSLREALEQQVQRFKLTDRVQFIGRVTEPDLPQRYAAADCFVLPTRALECFGLIVLEAFAAGTPVIASRAAAIPELSDRQGPGWDFEPGDAQGLARRMEAFIQGELRPTVDLPRIAAEFDRSKLFPKWRGMLAPEGRRSPVVSLPKDIPSPHSLQSVHADAVGR
jgi:glycosyltransferase involved in cell wall biosynthesis